MKRLILLLLLSSLISIADAQMLTVADFNARIGKSITSTSYSTTSADTTGLDAKLAALVGMTGTGQTWDFSSIAFAGADQATSITRAGIAGAVGAEDPKLASATHTAETTNESTPGFRSWTFYTLSGDILYTNGVTADSLGTLIYKIVNDPAAIEFKFPVQYGASWTAQTSNSLIDFGGETINREQRKEVTIDGAGTLIVPGKGGVPAIRMKSVTYGKTGPYLTLYFYDTATFYSVISTDGLVNGSISPSRPSPIPGQPGIPGTASYSFGTAGGGGSVAEAEITTVFNLSPNPASTTSKLTIGLENAAELSVSLFDALGREVVSIPSQMYSGGTNDLSLDLKHLSVGSYVVRLASSKGIATKQITVVR